MEEEKQFYSPAEAVRYLWEKRGIHYTVASLRVKRSRGKAHTAQRYSRFSVWTKEELDAIQPGHSGRPKTRNVSEQAA